MASSKDILRRMELLRPPLLKDSLKTSAGAGHALRGSSGTMHGKEALSQD